MKTDSVRLRRGALVLGSLLLFTAASAQPVDEHYESARQALSRGDVVLGKHELQLALQADPLNGSAHFLLASLLAREGNVTEAIVGFQQAASLEPNRAPARYNLGTALLWRNEAIPAARILEQAVLLDPDYVPAYVNLAKAYFLAGLPDLAVATYREALRRDPANTLAERSLSALTRAVADAGDARLDPPPPTPGAPVILAQATPGPLAPSGFRIVAERPALRPASEDSDLFTLREILRDLSHVEVDRRGTQLTLFGWVTGAAERRMLDRVLATRKDVLDLTSDDTDDPHRMVEVDAIIFKVLGYDVDSAGHNFLRRIEVNASVGDAASAAFTWMYSAAISYEVNIANASENRLAFLARPHLTTLSGAPATFIAGGDVVFRVAGLNSGDIKPYPYGTTLEVTPTLLRTRGEDGLPRVRLTVKAGRKTILPVADLDGALDETATVFENVNVTSEAVLALNQTLILTGINQREQRTRRSGVPGLKSIPVIKYAFSEQFVSKSDTAIVILLTPRDPAFWDEHYRKATEEFVQKRRAFIEASKGTEEDMKRFRDRYPDWGQFAPNHMASHFFLVENSTAYRRATGADLASEDLQVDILDTGKKKKASR